MRYAEFLGIGAAELERSMRGIERLADGMVHRQDANKFAMDALAQELNRAIPEIARQVGLHEGSTWA